MAASESLTLLKTLNNFAIIIDLKYLIVDLASSNLISVDLIMVCKFGRAKHSQIHILLSDSLSYRVHMLMGYHF